MKDFTVTKKKIKIRNNELSRRHIEKLKEDEEELALLELQQGFETPFHFGNYPYENNE